MCERMLVVRYADVRCSEAVVTTLEEIATKVGVSEPGVCVLPTRGPSRYFGGDEALAKHVALLVDEALRDTGSSSRCSVGIADGLFAAKLAASRSIVVPPGRSPAFLAPLSVNVLEWRSDLVGLLRRLGVRTLGDFAALPAADVLDRFGADGALAHRLASGLDETPFRARVPPIDWSVTIDIDPPLVQVDTAAFIVKSLAGHCSGKLRASGVTCMSLRIDAHTMDGDLLSRSWRHDGSLSAAAIAERLRWQLEGWLSNRSIDSRDSEGSADCIDPADLSGETGGITRLSLVPQDVIAHDGKQADFWSTERAIDERVARALVRVQGLLGEDGVVTGVMSGGRNFREQIRLVSWGDDRRPHLPTSMPWPGSIPGIPPSSVYERPQRAMVVDDTGSTVSVNGRGMMSASPRRLSFHGSPWEEIAGWNGPWLLDERWWQQRTARRCARFQMLTSGGTAVLAVLEDRQWWVEARYD